MLKFFYTHHTGWNGIPVQYAVGYETTGKNMFCLSFARCSDKDEFNKAKARLICKGRMEVGKHVTVVGDPDKNKYDLFRDAIEAHEENVKANYRQQA